MILDAFDVVALLLPTEDRLDSTLMSALLALSHDVDGHDCSGDGEDRPTCCYRSAGSDRLQHGMRGLASRAREPSEPLSSYSLDELRALWQHSTEQGWPLRVEGFDDLDHRLLSRRVDRHGAVLRDLRLGDGVVLKGERRRCSFEGVLDRS